MCGITGFTRLQQSDLETKKIITEMTDSLVHRGPDGEGYYIDTNIALGHRRLSIIDLETGNQPIFNEDRSVVVVYNGEIYNYRELRQQLELKGHKFYTKSDTEVIVHLYEDFGKDCVKKLNGIFAFSLWDKKLNKLILARDRLGVKPLHYMNINGHFVFGSEIKGILRHPLINREIDMLSLSKYLIYEYVPAPHTIFKHINKLLPAYTLEYDFQTKTTKLEQYWSPDFVNKFTNIEEEEAVERLLSILRSVVRKELVSDVPLGLFLSGGIDSNTLAFLMSEIGDVNSFCIGFTDRSFDESRHAREIAKFLGIKYKEEILDYQIMHKMIPEIVNFMDEPLADASIIPTYFLSKFARNHITVALSGDGGDELFAGYDTYQAHRLARYYKLIPLIPRKIINFLIDSLPVSRSNLSLDFRLKKFKSGLDYEAAYRNVIWLGSFTNKQVKELIAADINLNDAALFKDVDNYAAEIANIGDIIEKMQYLDLKLYLQDDILVKVDRASMANSLEVRVPFLNYELVDFVTRLPANFKLNGFKTKYILKKAIKNKIFGKILNRRKKGFGIPVAEMLRTNLKSLTLEYLNESKLKREGFFNVSYIESLLKQHFNGNKDNRKQIWTLLIFELWLERHN